MIQFARSYIQITLKSLNNLFFVESFALIKKRIEYLFTLFKSYTVPALTVSASINCSFHDDVPISREALALCTNLSTVFCGDKKRKEIQRMQNDNG